MNHIKDQIRCGAAYRLGLTGKGIGVAVLDTGIFLHRDFDSRVTGFADMVNGKTFAYDDCGHGTHICGIIGGSGRMSGGRYSGKTTLLEKLLPVLRSRGLKVGIIKHDGHDFTPDVPGTDSFRLREAGAEGVAVYSGTRYLLTEEFRLTEQDLLALFERHGYDLVLLEGFKSSGWPKIEVVRREIADAPVSFQPLAVVGDIPGADFGLEDIQPLADWIIAQMPTL